MMTTNTAWYVVDSDTGEDRVAKVFGEYLLLNREGEPVVVNQHGIVQGVVEVSTETSKYSVIYPEVEILKNEIEVLKAKLSEIYTITEALKDSSIGDVIFDSAVGDGERTVVTPSGVVNVTMLKQCLKDEWELEYE